MTAAFPKVLVVDDNHHIRSMLMKALAHYGYQVTLDIDCKSQIIHAAQNKRYGGMHQSMVDLPSAVKLLGTKRTLQVMRVFLVKMTLLAPIEILAGTFHKIWNNAMATASIARTLAENVAQVVTPERACILALFHNIGELLVLYLSNVRAMRSRQIMVEEELSKDILNSHCALGHQLCSEWGMSKEISEIALRHHDEALFNSRDSDAELKQKCSLIVMANHLALGREG
ncbi:MAG TPA: HDOD domain-containing protein [candidate division Zixibacteria bacterium]|nr:HDOD domain-containing protein [candidate division Zixibacteria bacterium]